MQTLRSHRHEQRTASNTLTSLFPWLCAGIGTLLLTGLSACGQASPDPIERATPTAAPSNQQIRSFNTNTRASLQPTPSSASERSTTYAQSQNPAARPALADTDPTAAARQQWLAEARDHPDVTVRRQALELWAEQPSRDLDPLTYALVDEDQSVRTRAQELYEQQLAREATTAEPATPDTEK